MRDRPSLTDTDDGGHWLKPGEHRDTMSAEQLQQSLQREEEFERALQQRAFQAAGSART